MDAFDEMNEDVQPHVVPPTTFRYQTPDLSDRKKKVAVLARSDVGIAAVQAIRRGGENNLHSHSSLDGFWFVLRGQARFYTTDDAVIGEFGPHEGVLIPHGYPYWFESSGEDILEILQVEVSSRGPGADLVADRVDHAPLSAATRAAMEDHRAHPERSPTLET